MPNDPKKQRIYLNLGMGCEDKILDFDFLEPLIHYFKEKGWKFKLRFYSEDEKRCYAYFEKELKKVKKNGTKKKC